MLETTDKLLVILVILGVAASLAGTAVTLSRLNTIDTLAPITGAPFGNATPTGKANVTIPTFTAISLPVQTVNFGSLFGGEGNDTTTNNPPPFTLQNDGNVNVNVTVGATDMFTATGAANPSNYFNFSSNVSEANSVVAPLNGGFSADLLNKTNMPATGSPTRVVGNLKFQNPNDLIKVDIYINVPTDEVAGAKTSTVTFTASQA